jgi:hypothetical protein
MERRADWSFIKLSNGRWMWRHTPERAEEGPEQSGDSFPRLAECIADAGRHGYDPKHSLAHISGPLGRDDALAVSKLVGRFTGS